MVGFDDKFALRRARSGTTTSRTRKAPFPTLHDLSSWLPPFCSLVALCTQLKHLLLTYMLIATDACSKWAHELDNPP